MAANGGPPPLPPASRTRITTIAGSPAQLVEDTFQLLADSPVVTAWPFVNWTFTSDAAAPPNRLAYKQGAHSGFRQRMHAVRRVHRSGMYSPHDVHT